MIEQLRLHIEVVILQVEAQVSLYPSSRRCHLGYYQWCIILFVVGLLTLLYHQY